MNPKSTELETSVPGPEVCAFTEELQTRAYRKLGEALGLGSDPVATHQRLSRPAMPATHVAPEKLQADLARQGITLSAEDAATKARALAAAYARYFSRPVPTPFEDPNRYPVLAMTFDAVHASLAAKGRPIAPRPYFATLPSGQVDARIVRELKTRSPVVFFERGLFNYVYDFALLTGWAVPILSLEQMADDAMLATLSPRHAIPPATGIFFASSLLAYVTNGNSDLKREPIPKPPDNAFVPMQLVVQMERFVMAHELAHLALGHLDRNAEAGDEFEADALGGQTLTELSLDEGGSWAMGFWGADLFFVALNFLYRTLGLITFGPVKLKWISVTHPDPLKRRSQLAARLRAECPRTLSLTAAGQLASMSDAVFQRLWELATPQLIQAYQNGARPSPVWQNLVTHTFAPA